MKDVHVSTAPRNNSCTELQFCRCQLTEPVARQGSALRPQQPAQKNQTLTFDPPTVLFGRNLDRVSKPLLRITLRVPQTHLRQMSRNTAVQEGSQDCVPGLYANAGRPLLMSMINNV